MFDIAFPKIIQLTSKYASLTHFLTINPTKYQELHFLSVYREGYYSIPTNILLPPLLILHFHLLPPPLFIRIHPHKLLCQTVLLVIKRRETVNISTINSFNKLTLLRKFSTEIGPFIATDVVPFTTVLGSVGFAIATYRIYVVTYMAYSVLVPLSQHIG